MKILIGIQPTGKLHLGHYFGIIKKGLELQKDN
jgi:tryptophanyl-tRNA synthetase